MAMAWRRRLASGLIAAAAVGALPALAQQALPSTDRLTLPMPAAPAPTLNGAGSPAMFDPEPIETGPEPRFDCGRELPCRLRLRGVIDKNGGVAVEGTAFTW